MSGKLYLVPTPIGNLEDMTFRAVNVLKSVDYILAEDTRTSSVLLRHFGISKPMKSHHLHNEHHTCEHFLSDVLMGKNLALITDAGTPGISDPGYLLVRKALDRGIDVECLPGATAFVPALVISGLASHEFTFVGFLPPKKGRQTKLKELAQQQRTIILYESPHKINNTLAQIKEFFGENTAVSLSRELSKKFEQTLRGTVSEIIDTLKDNPLKGEMVLVINGG